MISEYRFFKLSSRILVFVFVLNLGVGLAVAKSVYDPFIQKFQVGTYTDPTTLEMAWGFPSGLMETASIDTEWTRAGVEILSQTPSLDSPHLTLRLLAAMGDEDAAASWGQWHKLRIEQLQSWSDSLATDGQYLLAERMTMGFFRAMENGDLEGARILANSLATDSQKFDLPERDVFIWTLRSRAIGRMLKEDIDQDQIFWDASLKLGTYDMGNAWTLWTAHRRLNGYPALPPVLNTKNEARKLAVLRKSWLLDQDIEESAFSHDSKAGLGAKLLKKENLNQHLAKYPNPPADFTLQGWWVSGQRSSRRGQTGFYESLARRSDLKPGWQMDLFRRASEIHLLNGRWEKGLENLALALDKAGQNSGSAGQRRRLRQWTEQALVLALAESDTVVAREIYSLGTEKLSGEQKTVFMAETHHWSDELGLPEQTVEADPDFKTLFRGIIENGHSSTLKPVPEIRQQDFKMASGTPLWPLWAQWGLGLVKTGGSQNMIEYRLMLENILATEDAQLQEDLVVQAVASLMNSKLDKEALLRWVLDKDIHHLSGGRSLTAESPMSALAKKKLADPAALHAMLGIALLADDMRGIVGVATPMAQSGLTKREKLCFLYPLPSAGSVHAALSRANNDPALLLAVARNESLFEPSVRSRAGALGWMQIMPFHFTHKGARPGADNWSCAAVSIAKGDALLAENRRKYKGNPYLTVAAYNAGPGAVARWQKQLGGNTRDDIFLAWIGYPETRHYVEKVLIDREIYNWIISESRLN